MKTIFVKPRLGFKIPDPQLRDFLPADGREVPHDVYYACLLRDGDVVEVKADPEPGTGLQAVTDKSE